MATWGDKAREEMRKKDLLYFGDETEVRKRALDALGSPARAAFAAAAAQRVLARAEMVGDSERFARWRHLLDAIWGALQGDDSLITLVDIEVSRLDRWLSTGTEEPPVELEDVDEDHVATTLYAAEALMKGTTAPAASAAERAIDAAFRIVDSLMTEQEVPPDGNTLAYAAGHSLVQSELRRQRADLDLLAKNGPTADVLSLLRS